VELQIDVLQPVYIKIKRTGVFLQKRLNDLLT